MGLAAAINYLNAIGMDQVHAYEDHLAEIAYNKLSAIDGVQMYTADSKNRLAVMSFNIADAHPHDIATILDTRGVMVRSGHHCAMPLHTYLGISSTARASFAIYNTREEVEIFAKELRNVRKVMGL